MCCIIIQIDQLSLPGIGLIGYGGARGSRIRVCIVARLLEYIAVFVYGGVFLLLRLRNRREHLALPWLLIRLHGPHLLIDDCLKLMLLVLFRSQVGIQIEMHSLVILIVTSNVHCSSKVVARFVGARRTTHGIGALGLRLRVIFLCSCWSFIIITAGLSVSQPGE